MAIYKSEEIAGVRDGERIFCTEHSPQDFTQDQIITTKEVEGSEDFYFCDECGTKL